MTSLRTKATSISKKVRREVYERDKSRCILCGRNYNLQVAHFVPRSHGGLGIPRNLVILCSQCHTYTDQTIFRKKYLEAIEKYLANHYTDWDKEKLTYRSTLYDNIPRT